MTLRIENRQLTIAPNTTINKISPLVVQYYCYKFEREHKKNMKRKKGRGRGEKETMILFVVLFINRSYAMFVW